MYKIPKQIFEDPLLTAPLILGIAGARIYHVLDYWHLYSKDLISVFSIARGGLGIWGGLLGALLGFWIVAKIRKINVFAALDLVSPSLLLGQAVGRIGNYINQEGFGPPTSKPWGVFISEQNRPAQYRQFSHFQPTFFYEATIDFVFFLLLLYFSKRLMIKGQLFALYLIFYSTGRFIVEFWRIDTATIGTIKVAHLLSLVTFVLGVTIFKLAAVRNRTT